MVDVVIVMSNVEWKVCPAIAYGYPGEWNPAGNQGLQPQNTSGYERTVPWLELFQDHCQPKKDVPFETPWKMDSLYGWDAAW
jgi:hypothetical protein